MSNILTQSQIDELLNSVKEGAMNEEQLDDEVSSKKIRKYDFHTPKKYTKDRLKLIFSIYENYARVISSYLTSLLRLNFNVELMDVEEQRYYEFNNALNDDDLIALVDTKLSDSEENEQIMVQISNHTMYTMIDRMLGGVGDYEEESATHGFTDIELSIYEVLLKHILPIMKDAWQNYLDLNLEFAKIESNPRLVQTIGSDEIVVIVILSIELNETTGQINICLPGRLLDNVFTFFEKMREVNNKRKTFQDEASPEEILSSIKDSTLEITAKLGEAQVLMKDIYQLKAGDVINLKKPQDSDIYLYIEKKPWFRGKMGTHRGSMAVKINGSVNNQ
ncbi:flagellar motor switch protein FliM [Anaerovorax odorimutans]|uniref:flagellar motor switch protein FliM n=1 Tax=Anaerovorax odorimutans TaxID=109327 RepID=UPI00041FDF95|nr:flagellar motor switch protein FliM [Anaerovorax odorimutans]